jgi:hypothetical protein
MSSNLIIDMLPGSADLDCETMEDAAPINDLDSSSLIRTERRWLRQLSAFANRFFFFFRDQ